MGQPENPWYRFSYDWSAIEKNFADKFDSAKQLMILKLENHSRPCSQKYKINTFLRFQGAIYLRARKPEIP